MVEECPEGASGRKVDTTKVGRSSRVPTGGRDSPLRNGTNKQGYSKSPGLHHVRPARLGSLPDGAGDLARHGPLRTSVLRSPQLAKANRSGRRGSASEV